jgi:hypothetical protein
MNKYLQAFAIALIGCAALTACNSPKKLTARGDELALAGMYEEAAMQYMRALRSKPTYVDARVGLQKAGQKHLDALVGKFEVLHRERQTYDAVFAFVRAETFYRQVVAMGWNWNFRQGYARTTKPTKPPTSKKPTKRRPGS